MDYDDERARQQFILEVRSVLLMRGESQAVASIAEMRDAIADILVAYELF